MESCVAEIKPSGRRTEYGDREVDTSWGEPPNSSHTQNALSDKFEEFRCAVVIPCGSNRLENLKLTLEHLAEQTIKPVETIIVCDGWEPEYDEHILSVCGIRREVLETCNCRFVSVRKHQPGLEQPRNYGVRCLSSGDSSSANHVWFLDSDCIQEPDCLEKYKEAYDYCRGFKRVLIGRYDWLAQGHRQTDGQWEMEDYRIDMLNEHSYDEIFVEKLNVGLACFSGNLVWPIAEFKKVGGFWSEIHHGRCEDGELGLRAVAMGIPMSVVPEARAYHLWHETNDSWKIAANERDVPMINQRHPWVEGEGLLVVDQDGKRFDYICSRCNEQVNTLKIWEHEEGCK